MPVQRSGPYIWVTWLSKLLAGENSCEWAAWFKAHYTEYVKTHSTFDAAAWQLDHTALLAKVRDQLEIEGKTVFIESQNHFRMKGSSGTVLGGRPDLVAVSSGSGTIYDVKTGQPRESDRVQVALDVLVDRVWHGKVCARTRSGADYRRCGLLRAAVTGLQSPLPPTARSAS